MCLQLLPPITNITGITHLIQYLIYIQLSSFGKQIIRLIMAKYIIDISQLLRLTNKLQKFIYQVLYLYQAKIVT